MSPKKKNKLRDLKSENATVKPAASKEIMPELLSLVGRIIARNEMNPLLRQAGQLEFIRAARDIRSSPAKHLALGVYAMTQNGATFEAGLMMGLGLAFSSLHPTAQENIKKMLEDVTRQQNEEAGIAPQSESGAV
jgi:hypothetical protein